MAPTLIASYSVNSAGANTNALTTPSFTPANGEVIVVKMATWDTTITMTPSGGAQTYTSRKTAQPGGFACWCGVSTAIIAGSPGAMTISATVTASSFHSMVVERWGSATLATTPANNATINGSAGGSGVTTPTSNLTTTAANSVISWVSADVNALSPATRAYRLSATEDGLYDGSSGANSVQYYAYAPVAAAGTVVVGMTAPTGQNWVLAAIEILSAGGGTNVTATDVPSTGWRWRSSGGTVAAGLVVPDPPQGLRWQSVGGLAAVGGAATDQPSLGLRWASAGGPGVVVGAAVQDTPGGWRWASTGGDPVLAVTAQDQASVGYRLGASPATGGAAVLAADVPQGFRWRSSDGAGVASSLIVADTPAGLRWTSADGAATAPNVTIADVPAGLRWSSAAGPGAFAGVTVPDSGLGWRLGSSEAAVSVGVVVPDTPDGLRWLSGASTVVAGTPQVTVVDLDRGWFRLGESVAVPRSILADYIAIVAIGRYLGVVPTSHYLGVVSIDRFIATEEVDRF